MIIMQSSGSTAAMDLNGIGTIQRVSGAAGEYSEWADQTQMYYRIQDAAGNVITKAIQVTLSQNDKDALDQLTGSMVAAADAAEAI